MHVPGAIIDYGSWHVVMSDSVLTGAHRLWAPGFEQYSILHLRV